MERCLKQSDAWELHKETNTHLLHRSVGYLTTTYRVQNYTQKYGHCRVKGRHAKRGWPLPTYLLGKLGENHWKELSQITTLVTFWILSSRMQFTRVGNRRTPVIALRTNSDKRDTKHVQFLLWELKRRSKSDRRIILKLVTRQQEATNNSQIAGSWEVRDDLAGSTEARTLWYGD